MALGLAADYLPHFCCTVWQEYWSRLPFPSPGDLPNPGVKASSPVSPALQADSLPLIHTESYFYTQSAMVHLHIQSFIVTSGSETGSMLRK